jgi:hypothetical protein
MFAGNSTHHSTLRVGRLTSRQLTVHCTRCGSPLHCVHPVAPRHRSRSGTLVVLLMLAIMLAVAIPTALQSLLPVSGGQGLELGSIWTSSRSEPQG